MTDENEAGRHKRDGRYTFVHTVSDTPMSNCEWEGALDLLAVMIARQIHADHLEASCDKKRSPRPAGEDDREETT